MKFRPLKLFSFALLLSIGFLSACNSAHQSVKSNQLRYTPAELDAKVSELLNQMTLDEKMLLIRANGKFSVSGIERLGIPEMWLSDGPHGVRHEISRHSWASAGWTDDYSTYLPTLTAVAASWDPEMASLHGSVLGSEARHRNKDIILGPGVNLARLTLYGRNFEYFGEDPFLTAKLAVPEVIAIQEQDVAACVKHYALNTQELNRDYVDSKPDERALREVYLPAFEAVVKEAGTHTIMGAYNSVYSTNSNQSKLLVNDILKNEWGFEGVLLTDWNVKINTYDAAMNGLDLEMGTDVKDYDDYFFGTPLKKLIESGKVPVSVVDDKVRRILGMQFQIGMFDEARKKGERNTKAHREAAKKIAEESVVLLKNDKKLLPLNPKKLKKVLVMGPNANTKHAAGGGSSQVKTEYEVTPVEGLKNLFGDDVEIVHLKAESEEKIKPIEPEYILSRNWGSGTPTWDYFYYDTKEKNTHPKAHVQIVESRLAWPKGTATQHIIARTEIEVLESGPHTFKLNAKGQVYLKINDEVIFNGQNLNGKTIEKTLELKAGDRHHLSFHYDGADHFTLGWDAPGLPEASETKFLAAAKEADAVFYFGGLSHAEDREAKDRDDMKLPGNQDKVIEKLLAANKNTIVFIVAGSAVEMPWVDQADTLVWAWYGGMEGGNAYANVLTGKVNPGAKLPITLPKKLEDTAAIKLDDYNAKEMLYKEGVYIGYRWHEQQNIEPLFYFGHGLSYTSFEVSDLKMPKQVTDKDKSIEFSVKVKNTGKVAGAEVIQLYLGDLEASVSRPAKELKGFGKVFLKPGETKEVTIKITPRELAFWDVKSKDWKIEPGAFKAYLGTSIKDIKLEGEFNYL